MTQQQLADLCAVAQPRIAEIEAGKTKYIGLAILDRLADALGCEPGELIERTAKRRRSLR